MAASEPDENSSNSVASFSPTGRPPSREGSASSRLPFHYNQHMDENHSALISRYRYYNRLDPHGNTTLRMPDHVVPASFFSIVGVQDGSKKQSSIVTIFSIWNTMVGASLLSLPWALEQAGFILGLIFMFTMAFICFYTAYRVLENTRIVSSLTDIDGGSSFIEFTDVCRYYLGVWGERVSLGFSFLVLLGGAIVYWVLMSNFLYHTGNVIYDSLETNSSESTSVWNESLKCDVHCSDSGLKQNGNDSEFSRFWHLQHTVPIYLIAILFPLLNFESPTFFTKFNGLGTLSMLYLIIFVLVKAGECGIHLDFVNVDSVHFTPIWKSTFPALTGTLALSFFIHNVIVSIMRNQEKPQNNPRDLTIAYFLVLFTYFIISVGFYAAFPVKKSCIKDNLLDNFATGDLLSSIARLFLLFQMTTVLPLILYLLRIQCLHAFFKSIYPSWRHVVVFNSIVVSICVFFAIIFPKIGEIIRFVGALSGVAYIFTLPCVIHLMYLRSEGRLRWYSTLFHVILIVLGFANFFAQFATIGKKTE